MINKIYHISDVHVRLLQRHKEYREVFQRLFEYIDKTKEKDDVIVITGDVVHTKIEISSEMINLVHDFFKDCADRMPTILILGNHDINLRNAERLDPLTPIVKMLDHPNFHYWRETGVYELNDVHFSVFSVLDDPSKWTLAKDIDAKYKIALYHGTVDGAVSESGMALESKKVTLDLFKGFDLGLLGDIHQKQFLDKKKTIGYPSSLIQQNHGESIDGHGIFIWDLKKKKAEHVEIPNDYCYYTFHFKDGQWLNEIRIPKHARARFILDNTSREMVHKILDDITDVKFLTVTYHDLKSNLLDKYDGNDFIKDMRIVDNQNSYIVEHLKESKGITSEELIDKIFTINEFINRELPKKENLQRGVIWKPIKFEFSNMFSYGENNVIDFSDFKGSIGIFASNASGKTSLLNSFAFCLYDKCSVGSKGSRILNNKKDEFYCKVELLIGQTTYFIERIGTRQKNNVKVDVNFWCENNGERIVLTGEDRAKTNAIIREYLGTYEDFLVTCMSTQVGTTSFIDMTQADRKILLSKILDLDIFADLYRIAREKKKELDIEIRVLDEDKSRYELKEKKEEKIQWLSKKEELEKHIAEVDITIKGLEVKISDLNFKLHTDIIDIDISKINAEYNSYVGMIERANETSTKLANEYEEVRGELSRTVVDETKRMALENDLRVYSEMNLENKKGNLEQNLAGVNTEILAIERHKTQLQNHEYDPNCEFCVKNPIVQNARDAVSKLGELMNFKEKLEAEIQSKKKWIDLMSKCQDELADIKEIDRRINELTSRESLLYSKIESNKKDQDRYEVRKNELLELKERYEKQLIQIEENINIKQRINEMQVELTAQKNSYKALKDEYSACDVHLGIIDSKIKDYEIQLFKLKELKREQEAYDLYLKCVSKEGVPYRIMSVVLPLIQHEVNDILKDLVDFNIRLYDQDDKYIQMDVVYSDEDYWAAETASGMERFTISQAIRLSLSNITNLPKPNFISIDEGFGTLDGNSLASIYLLFERLKEKIDFILCISHIDTMKDIVDDNINVIKDKFSRIMN